MEIEELYITVMNGIDANKKIQIKYILKPS